MLTDVKTMLYKNDVDSRKNDRFLKKMFYYGRNYATLLSFLLKKMYTFLLPLL